MNCNRALELLSARLDGEMTGSGERELVEHLASCPACRAAGAQLAELQEAFAGLEDIPAPEGFTQGVMDRVQAGASAKKVVLLFKRHQLRVLAGLAACAVLAVGLYSASRQHGKAKDLTLRSFSADAQESLTEAPMNSAYSDGGAPMGRAVEEDAESGQLAGRQKAAPAPDFDDGGAAAGPTPNAQVLTLERMPEGGWELLPPETPVSPDGLHVTREQLAEIERLAVEQGITVSRTAGTEGAEEFIIVVSDRIES